MSILGIIWFFLVFLLIAVYFVLDGFDLGAGVLSPLLAKDASDRAIIHRAIGPVWDGNEVWLLTAGGALFAAFAPAYATTFSGFYLAIMLVLIGLIVRAVSLELGSHDKAWAGLWNVLFFVGSLLPALLCGVAAGNVYAGIPMTPNGDYAGVPLFGLVTPFTLLCGLLGLALMCLQGSGWISLKAPLDSAVRARARTWRKRCGVVALLLFVLVTVYALAVIKPVMEPGLGVVRIVFAVVIVAALVFSLAKTASPTGDLGCFLASSLSCAGLVFLWATSMFPVLVRAGSGDPVTLFPTPAQGVDITVATAASSELALGWMLGIACVGVPLVLVYHVLIYRAFAGREEAPVESLQ